MTELHIPVYALGTPWFGIVLVLGGLGGLILLLQWAKGRYGLHPEVARKLLHVGMGAITCALPWLFDSPWPVLILGVIAGAVLMSVRKVKGLRSQLGGVLHDVDRCQSVGELFFPLGVVVLFTVAHKSPLLYCLPLIVLSLADTGAALVGVRYGTRHFQVGYDPKSIEGSTAFLVVTLLCAIGGLVIFTPLSLPALFWVAIYFSLLMTIVEAVSWSGSDNLTIPIVGFLLLKFLLVLAVSLSVPQLILGSAIAVEFIAILWQWHSNHIQGLQERLMG